MTNDRHSPRVLAVVLNWCAEEESAACISSLLNGDCSNLDVLIVDNASPDGSGERLRHRFSALAFLQTNANIGYAGGNARAMQWALERGYDYVLVINDDAEVRADCVRRLVEVLESNPNAAAAAPTVLYHGTTRVWFGGGRFIRYKVMGVHERAGQELSQVLAALPDDESHRAIAATFLSGCIVLFRAQTLRAYGGFRPEFFAYVEDLEISIRFARKGLALLYVPSAIGSHKVPFPLPPDSAFAIELRDKNRRRVMRLHYSAGALLLARAWFYPSRMLHLVRFAILGDAERIRAVWRGAFMRLV